MNTHVPVQSRYLTHTIYKTPAAETQSSKDLWLKEQQLDNSLNALENLHL